MALDHAFHYGLPDSATEQAFQFVAGLCVENGLGQRSVLVHQPPLRRTRIFDDRELIGLLTEIEIPKANLASQSCRLVPRCGSNGPAIERCPDWTVDG